MQESYAYRVLSLSALRIMSRLEIELARHGGRPEENGSLPCTFEDFADYGVHRDAIAPAIRELVALGFIEITRKGSAGNAGFRQPQLYLLTYRHAGSDQIIKDGWRRIMSMEEAAQVAASARAKPSSNRSAREFGRRGGVASQIKKQKSTHGFRTDPTHGFRTDATLHRSGFRTDVPLMDSEPLSIVSLGGQPEAHRFPPPVVPPPPVRQERPYAPEPWDAPDTLHANIAKLPWMPPRRLTGQIRPRPMEMRLAVGDDALTDFERLFFPNALNGPSR
jgi:hypothetical protein